MSVPTTSKINSLIHSKYVGGLMFSEWLNKEGYSKQLLKKYRTTVCNSFNVGVNRTNLSTN